MTTQYDIPESAESAFRLGLRGRCPRCGEGHLFKGYLSLAPRCEVCGLDYSFADPADGPAFFAMWIGSIPALAFGIWLEMTFGAPLWVHFFTTFPLILIGCLAVLRPAKGWLVCSQYRHKAEEARFEAARKETTSPSTDGTGNPGTHSDAGQ
ncbi:uncharacterized protein (DUF983 family) [Pseudochelatococcus lubricantis]|uniref:Uncharacterized protein (DUF983 family) n=1 Tax=Pseudochelatococcus lubricantis TaxID=1538102 RepID=A0ABX0UXL9_9HYPH|nr:DUF983 domain-containing protein [Pseudochelatococcus lubricantis]NIJ57693.1 uncharacterized protein (DUF983 family) [Pseudochelatococcus lubricantis]